MNRIFAIIPAAGVSQRMGQPKLLLNWNGRTIIENLVRSIHQAGISEILVVIRPDDTELEKVLKELPVITVIPKVPPADMKASIQYGLEEIRNRFNPSEEDGWLLTPADYPMITEKTVQSLVQFRNGSNADIVLPLFQDKRGHPILISWKLVDKVFDLPDDQGLNSLIRSPLFTKEEIPVDDPGVIQDIDTPEDYQKYQN